MNDHAFAAILRDPEGLREGGREIVDRVHPGAAPEVARLAWPPQPYVWRAVPAKPVEDDGALLRPVWRPHRDANRLDRLSAGVGETPVEDRFVVRRQNDGLRIEWSKAVACAVDKGAQTDSDFTRVLRAADDARLYSLPRIDERRRHQFVGAHARDFGRSEGWRHDPGRVGSKSGEAQLEGAPTVKRYVRNLDVCSRAFDRGKSLRRYPACEK